MIPRATLKGTRAAGQLSSEFWGKYVRAYWLGGDDKPIGGARAVFTESACAILQSRLGFEALMTPVLFSENLSNRVLASNISLQNGSQCIVINSRFKVDPEILAHTILEEFVHAWQRIEKVDFAAQRSQFAYDDRPYEIEAKRIATEILGYEPDAYENFIRREEPDGVLYDSAG